MNAEKKQMDMIGKNISILRRTGLMTQADLAEKAGLSREFIGQVERGVVNPTVGNLSKIAHGLDADLDIRYVKH